MAVGMATYQATRGAVEYRELDPAFLKGKAEPGESSMPSARRRAPAWTSPARKPPPTSAGGRAGGAHAAVRDHRRETPVRLVTVIGEAGMGKSRMVAELRAHVDKRGR